MLIGASEGSVHVESVVCNVPSIITELVDTTYIIICRGGYNAPLDAIHYILQLCIRIYTLKSSKHHYCYMKIHMRFLSSQPKSNHY